MQYTCEACGITHKISKKDFKTKDFYRVECVGRKTNVKCKRRFFGSDDYTIKRTYTNRKNLWKEKYIECFACGDKHVITEELIKEGEVYNETKYIDEWEAFGNNHPKIVGTMFQAYMGDF